MIWYVLGFAAAAVIAVVAWGVVSSAKANNVGGD